MNKIIIIFFTIIAVVPHEAWGQNHANYEISINGETYDISLGRDYQIKSNSGETLHLRVSKKAVMKYKNGNTSFKHKSDLVVSSTDLGNGIRQTMTTTAVGTLILIQEYSTMNPTTLVNLMLQELTKEQVSYGYNMQKLTYSKALKDGTKLDGKKAVLKYKDEEEYWCVLAYGKKDSGFLVITKIDKENFNAEKKIIDLMWETLQIDL
jgi:hypothetical protein